MSNNKEDQKSQAPRNAADVEALMNDYWFGAGEMATSYAPTKAVNQMDIDKINSRIKKVAGIHADQPK